MNLLSAARKSSDFRVLYPRGVKRIDQVPWPLQEAINHGLVILSWFENYMPEELPHENLWDDAEAVEEHFRRVKEKKDSEFGRSSGTSYDDAEESDQDMLPNDLSSVFKR